MTAPYKKRALAGWNHDKKQSNRDERQYEPNDIQDQVAEESKVLAKPKNKPTKTDKNITRSISNLRYALKRGGGSIEALKDKADKAPSSWSTGWYMKMYQDAKKEIPELRELLQNPEIKPKIKRQIQELLDQAGEL